MRKVAKLTFSSALFSIPGGGSSCNEAYVEILANEGVSMSLGRFCGNSIPSPITSSTNKIKVVFHSGTTLSAFLRGFKLSYESVNLEGMLKFEYRSLRSKILPVIVATRDSHLAIYHSLKCLQSETF